MLTASRGPGRWMLITSMAAALLYFLVSAFYALSPQELAKRHLFFPVKTRVYCTLPERLDGAILKHCQFRDKNKKGPLLHGAFIKKPGAKYVLLLHYGQGGNMAMNIGLARMALAAGQSVFTYDYRGYGMSYGEPSIEGLLDDGIAAHDYLVKDLKVPPSQLVQYGVSLGTGVACHVAERRKSAGVILMSPYTSLKDAARDSLPFLRLYPDSMFPETEMGAMKFMKRNRSTPVFIWHGGKDLVIRPENTKRLTRASGAPVTLYLEARLHHGDWSINEMSERVKLFLSNLNADVLGKDAMIENNHTEGVFKKN